MFTSRTFPISQRTASDREHVILSNIYIPDTHLIGECQNWSSYSISRFDEIQWRYTPYKVVTRAPIYGTKEMRAPILHSLFKRDNIIKDNF